MSFASLQDLSIRRLTLENFRPVDSVKSYHIVPQSALFALNVRSETDKVAGNHRGSNKVPLWDNHASTWRQNQKWKCETELKQFTTQPRTDVIVMQTETTTNRPHLIWLWRNAWLNRKKYVNNVIKIINYSMSWSHWWRNKLLPQCQYLTLIRFHQRVLAA